MSRRKKDGIFYQLHYFSSFHFSLGFFLSSIESWKKKEGKPLRNSIALCPFFDRKWRGELMYLLDLIRRDWRGSNPQHPPWQGGALAYWTTIPGKKEEILQKFWILFYSLVSGQVFLKGSIICIVDWRIVGPSWIWTSVDILSTNLQSVPFNHSGIDPASNLF